MKRRRDVTADGLMALRETGMSNRELAEMFGVSLSTVSRRIGTQPKAMSDAAHSRNLEKGRRVLMERRKLS